MLILIKILDILTFHEKKRGLLVLILVGGMAIFEVVGIVSIMPFLAVLGNVEMISNNLILSAAYEKSRLIGVASTSDFLMMLGSLSFGIIVFSSLYKILTLYVLNRYIEMRRYSISSRLMQSYLRQPYEYFLNNHSGDLSKTVLSEVDQFVKDILGPVIHMMVQGLVLVVIFLLLAFSNFSLAITIVGILSFLYGVIYLTIRGFLHGIGRVRAQANRERYMAASEAFGGVKSIKLFGKETAYLNRFDKPAMSFARAQAANATLSVMPSYLIEAFLFGGILLLTVIMLSIHGLESRGGLGLILPTLGLYAFSAYRIKPAAHAIFNGLASLRFGEAMIYDLHQGLTMLDKAKAQNIRLGVSAPILDLKESIIFQNIGYTYPLADGPTLSAVNLEISVGSSVGIIGATGSGKTTLVDLILGLLRPTEGSMYVDGQLICDTNLRGWQNGLGYVPQEIFLTDTSIAENIALGIPIDKIDYQQIKNCAKLAQLDDFVEALPEKYNAVVGERGVRLSGGQRQRIGIARALYHNPNILIFDEATSSLDSATEELVMRAINNLCGKKTIFIIAHRLNTISKCDQILMLENGRVNHATNNISHSFGK